MIGRSLTNLRLCRGFGMWKDVPTTPPDPILGLNEKFKESKDARKVNLTVGAYRDENGKPWILPSVKMALKKVHEGTTDLEYGPILGDKEFVRLSLTRFLLPPRLLMVETQRPLLRTELLEPRPCLAVVPSTWVHFS
jgi:aspartate/tyrosine/aromatic aminotransferase